MAENKTKTYKVRFYDVDVRQPEDAEAYTARELFRDLKSSARGQNGLCPSYSKGGLAYEIRELRSHNNNAVFTGIFAVTRDDAPHIRRGNGDEQIIALREDEGVLEKNHFIFYSSQRLLVFQVNQRASHPARLEEYLTFLAGLERGVVLADILTSDAWELLRRGQVKKVHMVLSAPRNAQQYDPEDFAGKTMQTMERAGATRTEINLSISGGRRGMSAWLKGGLQRLRERENVESLRVQLDGDDKMLDLLANTVRDAIEVQMDGRYPNTRHTLEELQRAKDRQREALDGHFGP
jgi:hypothetical protein